MSIPGPGVIPDEEKMRVVDGSVFFIGAVVDVDTGVDRLNISVELENPGTDDYKQLASVSIPGVAQKSFDIYIPAEGTTGEFTVPIEVNRQDLLDTDNPQIEFAQTNVAEPTHSVPFDKDKYITLVEGDGSDIIVDSVEASLGTIWNEVNVEATITNEPFIDDGQAVDIEPEFFATGADSVTIPTSLGPNESTTLEHTFTDLGRGPKDFTVKTEDSEGQDNLYLSEPEEDDSQVLVDDIQAFSPTPETVNVDTVLLNEPTSGTGAVKDTTYDIAVNGIVIEEGSTTVGIQQSETISATTDGVSAGQATVQVSTDFDSATTSVNVDKIDDISELTLESAKITNNQGSDSIIVEGAFKNEIVSGEGEEIAIEYQVEVTDENGIVHAVSDKFATVSAGSTELVNHTMPLRTEELENRTQIEACIKNVQEI